MDKNKLRMIILPIVIVLAVVVGMFANSLFSKHNMAGVGQNVFMPTQGSKLDMILNMINYSYVDTVNMKDIEENAISQLIKDLDPHTVYIPAEELQKVNEDMVGNFGGIGVQFYKYRDTVLVLQVVPGGPSEQAGVLNGDRIVKVNDSIIAGRKMDTDKIMKMMRGEIGTEVALTLVRRGEKEPVVKNIVRGTIPVKSVEVAYMVNDTTGYVNVRTFGMNTYNEFIAALDTLSKQGMKRVIVDMRGNAGGILPIAIKMINEFLADQQLILYTQGKASPRVDYKSNGKGKYQQLPITVLIDDFSASASEIFAGAIQDNDRGIVIGRRSFGKGLVQEQRVLPDGSALSLTVARYYIPSGRSIQKPYDKGKEKYYEDIYDRYVHGEFEQKDSIRFDEKLKFETLGGRTVYGGGGVMPDIFVPADTSGSSAYLARLDRSQSIYEYSIDFLERHRDEMKSIKNYKELLDYMKNHDFVEGVVTFAEKRGIPRDTKGINISSKIIDSSVKAYLGRLLLNDEGFYPIYGLRDKTLKKALENSSKAEVNRQNP